jgi:hypothetical protein
VLDGNWAQAKALWWRNAWLTRLRRFVVVPTGRRFTAICARRRGPTRLDARSRGACAVGRGSDATVREKLLVPFRALIAKARPRESGRKRDRRSRR